MQIFQPIHHRLEELLKRLKDGALTTAGAHRTAAGQVVPSVVLILGGTGNFGSRICHRLAGEPGCRLIVTSRSEDRARGEAASLIKRHPGADIVAAAIDIHRPALANELQAHEPHLVIHTAGPFQGQDYRVARACLDSGLHYVDLADGRDFVAGIGRLDQAARESNLLLVSGASTLPGVSSAVIDAFSKEFFALRNIEISIAPGHQTPRGLGTIAAVLSYCGRPFKVLEGGAWVTRHGWQDLRLQRYPALGRRLSGACDVPDLELLPKWVNGCETLTFHAAMEAWWEQIALWLMASLTRAGIVSDWSKFAPAFQRLSRRLVRLGSDRGGMHVRIEGLDVRGGPTAGTWFLTVGSNHGPEIPCTPALVLARKLVRGELSVRGAYPCLGLMSLSDFDAEMADFDVKWQFVE